MSVSDEQPKPETKPKKKRAVIRCRSCGVELSLLEIYRNNGECYVCPRNREDLVRKKDRNAY